MIFKGMKAAGDLITGTYPHHATGKTVPTKSFGEAAADIAALDVAMREYGFAPQFGIVIGQNLQENVSRENINEICSSPESYVQVMRDVSVGAAEKIIGMYKVFDADKKSKAAAVVNKVGAPAVVKKPSVRRTALNLLKGNIFNIIAAHDSSIVPATQEERIAKMNNAMKPIMR